MSVESCKDSFCRYYQIGGFTIQLESDLPITDTTFRPRFKPFQVDGPGEDNIVISHHFYQPDLDFQDLGDIVYRRVPMVVYKKGNLWIYLIFINKIEGKISKNDIHQLAILDPEQKKLTIYTNGDKVFRKGNLDQITMFPSDQIFLSHILADRDGFYIHSSGAILKDKGFLFVGHSGAGKTTIAEMLKDRAKAEILCEDRVIVRKWPEGFKIHGTWNRRLNGGLRDVSANSAKLRATMFLKQAPDNRLVTPENKVEVTRRLLACLVKPLVSAEWWNKMLSLVEEIAGEVPCYILEFDKSGRVVDLLERL